MNFKKIFEIVLISCIIFISLPSSIVSCQIVETGEPELKIIIEVDNSLALPEETDGSFKTYMDYRTITNKNSTQYQMQTQAYTNSDGFRIYDERYMIAVGTAYADKCGTKLDITLEDDTVLHCITGDIKSDTHTDVTNRYIPKNGNIVEFIVDTKTLSSTSRKMGDVSHSGLYGGITKIEVVE